MQVMVIVTILFQRDDLNLIVVVDVMMGVVFETDCREIQL